MGNRTRGRRCGKQQESYHFGEIAAKPAPANLVRARIGCSAGALSKPRKLTYMSIEEALIRLSEADRLVPLPRSAPWARQCRATFLGSALHQQILQPDRLDIDEIRAAHLLADLQSFAEGLDVGVPGFLKPLSGGRDGVWEIRRRKPRPSLRVFGLFGRRDVLVLTHAITRNTLADRSDPAWRTEIRRARFFWRQLLPDHAPLIGGKISDYLSPPFHLDRGGFRRRGDCDLAALDRL